MSGVFRPGDYVKARPAFDGGRIRLMRVLWRRGPGRASGRELLIAQDIDGSTQMIYEDSARPPRRPLTEDELYRFALLELSA